MTTLDIDEDGIGEIATMTANGLTVDWSDGSTSTYFGSGELTVADADGDGWEDLVATDVDLNRVWIYRNLGNGLAPPWVPYYSRIGGTVRQRLSGDGVQRWSSEILMEESYCQELQRQTPHHQLVSHRNGSLNEHEESSSYRC